MTRTIIAFVVAALCVAALPGVAVGADDERFLPGAAGVGDPYFPLDGNGGYDVEHYRLDVAYDPPTDRLTGVATITARATMSLSRFNLDLDGLTVRSVHVDHRGAAWSRTGSELSVIPRTGLREASRFRVVVRYDGVPQPTVDAGGPSGFLHTDDGALVIGQPHVAATWFPVNDHPRDKATYVFRITVPEGLEAVANGTLKSHETSGGLTTWMWGSKPMASYLATATIGHFDVRSYREDGIKFWDAIDPDLFDPVATPQTGEQFALSQAADLSYKRLARTISVPTEGADLSFSVTRNTEPGWDFMFVEAHTPGQDDWTTLPDTNGHTKQGTGFSCPAWLGLHPFLEHYQTAVPSIDPELPSTCSPTGTTGEWWAASGASRGPERWAIDLSPYAGADVEVSITYASDDVTQKAGVFVDDVIVSNGPGTTSFEADGDELDGWSVPGAPAGSASNTNDWIAGTVEDSPPTTGEIAEGSLARQGEILGFLQDNVGPYPFSAAGGIVDDANIVFALENQTRPIYSKLFFVNPVGGDSVVVHELAHQWFGDSLAVRSWRHIWLNEGFATYAEWMWSEEEGLATAQQRFDSVYAIPASSPFWSLTIGDPGPDALFDDAVYSRGAMTLHQLRLTVGERDFHRILRRWASTQAGGLVTTKEFVALAEQVSGRDLHALFETWLFTPGRPVLTVGPQAPASSVARSQQTSRR